MSKYLVQIEVESEETAGYVADVVQATLNALDGRDQEVLIIPMD